MKTINSYRYSLDKSSKKFKCPSCGHKRVVLYKDNETNNYLSEDVGRCDRENDCGYHFTPKEYFEQKTNNDNVYKQKHFNREAEIDFIPILYVDGSMSKKFLNKNNLFIYLSSLFSETVAIDLFKKYLIGTSKYWLGSNIYWQIDTNHNARHCKLMLYDSITGKRIKKGATVNKFDNKTRLYKSEVTQEDCSKIYGRYIDDSLRNLNLQQCFFGEHLLTEYIEKKVCIVESEKTALIACVYYPQFIWLATGAAIGGCKWREYSVYKVLQSRQVTFFPDYGYANKEKQITCFAEWNERVKKISSVLPGNFKVSDLIENKLNQGKREDQDLADILITRDDKYGWALKFGFPAFWEYESEEFLIKAKKILRE